MICTSCQKAEAVVFIKQIIKNQVSQATLCAACAAKANVSLKSLDPFSALRQQLLPKPVVQRAKTTHCPGCGISWSDFRSAGRLGCARCYSRFAAQLKPLIPRIHTGAYAHRGKSPKRLEKP